MLRKKLCSLLVAGAIVLQSAFGLSYGVSAEQADPVNLFTGKTAWADSQTNSGESAMQAIDGELGTKWCSTAKTSLRWMIVDLGTETTFDTYVIRHAEAGGEFVNYNAKDFFLQSSNDGKNWTTFDSIQGNTAAVTERKLASPITARYIKLVQPTPDNQEEQIVRVYEFELYNGDYPEPADGWSPDLGSTPNGTVAIEQENIQLDEHGTLQLTAAVTGDLAAEDVLWMTDDPSVATVTRNGMIAAVSAGETIVYATDVSGRIMAQKPVKVSGKVYTKVNLALNKPTRQDSVFNASSTGTQAVDGDVSSKWCSTANDRLRWMIIDLEQPTTFDTYVVRHAQAGGEDGGYNTKDFFVQSSSDGMSWTTFDCIQANSAAVTSRKLAAPVTARYVRLMVVSPTNNDDGAVRINEVELYNDDYPEPVEGWSAGCTEAPSGTLSIDGEETLILQAGESAQQLTVTKTGTVGDVCWMTDDPQIARITKDGKITGAETGTTTVYAIDIHGAVTASKPVRVKSNNIANRAEITVNNTFPEPQNFQISHLVDGDLSTEWCGEWDVHPYVDMQFGFAAKINKIVYYGRHNGVDCAQSVKIIFSDGSSIDVPEGIPVGDGQNTAAPVVVEFDTKTTTSVRIEATAESGCPGFSEIEIYSIDFTDAESVAFDVDTQTVKVGESKQVTAKVLPTTATYPELGYTSSDETVATVDADGTVHGIKAGSAVITATNLSSGKSDTYTIEVQNVAVESVVLSDDELTLEIGKTHTLTYTINPSHATVKTVSWQSDHPEIASVVDGYILAVAPGDAVITITATDSGVTDTCTVHVTASSIDLTGLREAIASSETLREEDYTPSSWKTFKEKLDAAKAALESAETQEDADAARKALLDARAALVDKVDKTALDEAVKSAKALKADEYTEASFALLASTLETAKAVLANEEASQEEVDLALENLTIAVSKLEKSSEEPPVPVVPVEKDKLDGAIKTAEQLDSTRYTPESWAVYQSYIAAAKLISNMDDVTQAMVDAAEKSLADAKNVLVLKTAVKPVVKNGWKFESGSWRYYRSGTMQKGWLKDSGKWYYLDAQTGVMKTGWVQVGAKWYFMNSSGAMQTGWKKLGAKWYFFEGSGAMVTGWKQLGKWYFFNANGAMQTGWTKVGAKWYYMDGAGAMQTGWKKIGAKWYFFEGSGKMLASTSKKLGGRTYRFSANGACLNP